MHHERSPAPPAKRRAAAPDPAVKKTPKKTATPRRRPIKPPHILYGARPAADEPTCAFCLIPGTQRAVEGELLGPFDVAPGKRVHAHRNCIVWTPEVWFDDEAAAWHGVDAAYARSRKYKCALCGAAGASLGCMFGHRRCCRPMHFRCALLKGAALVAAPAFVTLCPSHASRPASDGAPPPAPETCAVQTPVPLSLMAPEAAVKCCARDNHDLAAGHALHCHRCGSGVHSRCLDRNFEYGGALSVAAAAGNFRCRDCQVCEGCTKPVGSTPDTDLVRCRNCNHHTAHRRCVNGDLEQGWRCDLCRVCYHCMFKVATHDKWSEKLRACPECAKAIDEGEAICPSCDRVWREDLGGMIQCDGCDAWLHSELECSNLTPQQLEVMTKTNKRYDCPKCTQAAKEARTSKLLASSTLPKANKKSRGKAKQRPSKNGRARARPQRADPSPGETTGMFEQVVYGSSDEDDGAPFRHFEKSTNTRNSQPNSLDLSAIVGDAGPHTELCLTCCTSGFECSLRYCGGCGEAFHGFCTDGRLPERVDGPLVSSHPGTRYRLSAGGLGPNARQWRCQSCTACIRCGHPDETSVIILCDHCDRGVHISCLSPPLERPPDGAFFCDECRYCEMCGIHTVEPKRIREHCFCDVCTPIVESGSPCSVCSSHYPAAPRISNRQQVDPALEGTPDVQMMELTAAKCSACSAVIHSECDFQFTSSPSYRCPPCRDNSRVTPMDCATEPGTHNAVYSDVSGPTTPEREGAPTKMAVDKKESTSEEVMQEIDITGATKSTRPSFRWRIDSTDRRRCEFCLCGETEEARTLGRLLPLPPELGSNHQFMWVHAACMVWSSDVKIIAGNVNQVGLYGQRRIVLPIARATACVKCGKRGATVYCRAKKCRSKLHLACAFEDGLNCVRLNDKSKEEEKFANMPLFCKNHTPPGAFAVPLKKAHQEFDLSRYVRVVRIKELTGAQVYGPFGSNELKKAKARPKALVRVGALTVVSLGRLVPDSGEYIIRGSLVPTGYRATRLYWSMTTPGKRCLYFLEVTGDASSGPQFSVWTEEDPKDIIEGIFADEVWGKVRSRVESVFGGDAAAGDSASCAKSGLEAFGLKKCRPVVTLIESMPMAWMFRKRYEFKYRNPRPVDTEVERLLFGSNGFNPIVPAVNKTGCSRTEGYVPKRWRSRLALEHKEAPTYVNPCTGEQFQIRVAMESEGFGDFSPDVFGRHLAPPSSAVSLSVPSRRKKTDENFIGLPPARLYIMMRERQQRRDGHKIVVLRSRIEGMGVFATQPIRQGEFIIEYAGAEIRPAVSDLREKQYNDKSIGCYMFAIRGNESSKDIKPVVDATMTGNAARYINHSCDPNCDTREIKNDKGKASIVIVSIRSIRRGEELAYDYRLSPDSTDRAECVCGAVKCRGFMDVEE